MVKINWNNPEEVKEYHRAYKKLYRNIEKNKEKHREEQKIYYQLHREEILEKRKNSPKTQTKAVVTPNSRAHNLLSSYVQSDNKHNRGECTLTAKWIIENIFSKPCAHCGKTGWDVIGCNRLNNDLPHTVDNVEPCCAECNKKLTRK